MKKTTTVERTVTLKFTKNEVIDILCKAGYDIPVSECVIDMHAEDSPYAESKHKYDRDVLTFHWDEHEQTEEEQELSSFSVNDEYLKVFDARGEEKGIPPKGLDHELRYDDYDPNRADLEGSYTEFERANKVTHTTANADYRWPDDDDL